MPYIDGALMQANQLLAGPPPGLADLAAKLDDVGSVLEAAESLGLLDVLDDDQVEVARAYAKALPPEVDAAILGAVRSGLRAGQRVQFLWRPAQVHGVRVETIRSRRPGVQGTLTIELRGPSPAGDEWE